MVLAEALGEVDDVIAKLLHVIIKSLLLSLRPNPIIQYSVLVLFEHLKFVQKLSSEHAAEGLRNLVLDDDGDELIDKSLNASDLVFFIVKVHVDLVDHFKGVVLRLLA